MRQARRPGRNGSAARVLTDTGREPRSAAGRNWTLRIVSTVQTWENPGMTIREGVRADPDGDPALGASRASVLTAVRAAPGPIGVVELAVGVGLHPNTVRFHLHALVTAGLVVREAEDRDHPGRPRTMYTASLGGGRAGRRSYRLLAQILTGYVATQTADGREGARRAGFAWGRYLTDRPPPFRPVDADTAVHELVVTLDDLGFAPQQVDAGGERQIHIHNCPFRETALEHLEVVCSVHLGLMQGLLAELDAPLVASGLDPFVEPSLCVTHLGPSDKPG
jgi:predicted ArsR family transcriptional regulator